MEKADAILIGGGMAYTFLRAQGQSTGKSLVEEDKIDIARAALEKARSKAFAFSCPSITCSPTALPPDAEPVPF